MWNKVRMLFWRGTLTARVAWRRIKKGRWVVKGGKDLWDQATSIVISGTLEGVEKEGLEGRGGWGDELEGAGGKGGDEERGKGSDGEEEEVREGKIVKGGRQREKGHGTQVSWMSMVDEKR